MSTRDDAVARAEEWLLSLMGKHDFTVPTLAFGALVRAIAAREGQAGAEPVAWVPTQTLEKRQTTTTAYLWFSDPRNTSWTPVYTHPAPVAQTTPCTVCNALILPRSSTHYDAEDLAAAGVRGKLLAEKLAPVAQQATPAGQAASAQASVEHLSAFIHHYANDAERNDVLRSLRELTALTSPPVQEQPSAPTGAEAEAKRADELQAEVEGLRKDAERREQLAFEFGWRTAAGWSEQYHLISDIGSAAYIADRESALSDIDAAIASKGGGND